MSTVASVLLLALQLLGFAAPRIVAPGDSGSPVAAWAASGPTDRAAPIDRATADATLQARVVRTQGAHARSATGDTPALPTVAPRARAWTHGAPVAPMWSHAVSARGGHLPYFPTAPPAVG